MANKYSISTKQAVMGGLGIAAIVTGIIIALSKAGKKKKKLQKSSNTTMQTTKSIMT